MMQFVQKQPNTATPFGKAAFSACTSASSNSANMMILGTAIAVSIFVLSIVSILASMIISIVLSIVLLAVLVRITVLHIQNKKQNIRWSAVQKRISHFA